MIKYYRDVYGVLCSSLRFSNIYGPLKASRPSDRKVINKILDHIHKSKEVTLVEDGRFYRNYVHVFDCAEMLIHIAQEIENTSPILLGCSNENLMFKEVIGLLLQCYKDRFNEKIDIKYGMEKRFLTDLRQFSAKPSIVFQQNFNFKFALKDGFRELVNELEEY